MRTALIFTLFHFFFFVFFLWFQAIEPFFNSAHFEFPIANLQGRLEEIQRILNTTEISLHQLTALVDCRSLHMVSRRVTN